MNVYLSVSVLFSIVTDLVLLKAIGVDKIGFGVGGTIGAGGITTVGVAGFVLQVVSY